METSNVKVAVSCAVRYIITALLTFFIYLSVTVVVGGIFYETEGYTVYRLVDGQNQGELYRYSFSEGEDTKYKEYEELGYELLKVETPKKLSGAPKYFTDATTQILGAVILFGFIYSHLWKLGDSDRNLVVTGNGAEDKLRGLKIGLIANAPIYLSFVIFILAKAGVLAGEWYAVFRFLNFPQFSIINALYGQATSTAADISWTNALLGILTFIVIPLFTTAAYILGYKRINISEKLIYKKK